MQKTWLKKCCWLWLLWALSSHSLAEQLSWSWGLDGGGWYQVSRAEHPDGRQLAGLDSDLWTGFLNLGGQLGRIQDRQKWAIGYGLLLDWQGQSGGWQSVYKQGDTESTTSPLALRKTRRRHHLPLFYQVDFGAISWRLVGFYEWQRFGSDIAPGPRDDRIEDHSLGELFDWRPQIVWRYQQGQELQLGLVYRKFVSHVGTELSYKSYSEFANLPSWFLVWKSQPLWWQWQPELKWMHYRFLRQRASDDYKRFGFQAFMTKSWQPWRFKLGLLWWQDDYLTPGVGCSSHSACLRRDDTYSSHIEVGYHLAEAHELYGYWYHKQRHSREAAAYDRSSDQFLFGYRYLLGSQSLLPAYLGQMSVPEAGVELLEAL